MMQERIGLALGFQMLIIWIPLLVYLVLLAVLFSTVRLYEGIATSIAQAIGHAKRNH